MKILFVACYVDNPHFIDIMKKSLDKYLLNCTYDFICLNDAPDIKNGEENFLKICDIISGDENFRSPKTSFLRLKVGKFLRDLDFKNSDQYK